MEPETPQPDFPVLDALGARFDAAIRRQRDVRRPRHARQRRVVLVASVAALAAASVAAGQAVFFQDDPSDLERRIDRAGTPAALAPARGTTVVQELASDPDGGAPWGIMTYQSETGQLCMVHGRMRDGQLGTFRPDGAFAEYPKHEGGSCVALSRLTADTPVSVHRSTGLQNLAAGETERTAIWGVAPGAREVLVQISGHERKLELGHSGAFLSVYAGDHAEAARATPVQVTTVLEDGTRVGKTLTPPPVLDEKTQERLRQDRQEFLERSGRR